MDYIQINPAPLDSKFPLSFATTSGYSAIADSKPGATQMTSHVIGSHERQMPWTSSTSVDSNWSNGISSGNGFVASSQYHHLLAQLNESKRENAALLTRNVALEAKVETLMTAYNMLLTHIPAASAPTCHVALRQQDYPNVRFWTRQDWNVATQDQVLEVDPLADSLADGEVFPEVDEEDDGSKEREPSPLPGPACARGKHRSSQGINVTMKYIELEDGTVVDGFRAAEIRRYARSLWVQMALDAKLPRTWSDADATSLATYNESMAQRFVELRLCASDWKANLVATDNYPSWRHNWLKKKNKEGSASKRPAGSHLEANVSTTKKPKVLPENGEELLAQLPPGIPQQQVGPLNTIPIPAINVIPGTPSRPEPTLMPIPPANELHVAFPQPTSHHNFNFTIGNPLAFNSNKPLVNFTSSHEPVAPALHQVPALSTEISMQPTAANLPSTSVQPPPPADNNVAKRMKGTRMRPTKTTTARNLCALEWVKNNPQGTTDEFKVYYNSLSEEQKQVWEEKSKVAS